jgi:hypothetical protein
MRAFLTLVLMAAAAALVLTGCPVPLVPRDLQGSRQNMGERRPDFIVGQVTTREDILLRLGEPDGRWAEDRWFVYGSRRSEGGVSFMFGRPTTSVSSEAIRYRRLLLRFDEKGLVESASFVDRLCSSYAFRLESTVAESDPCLDVRSDDVAPGGWVDDRAVLGLEPDETIRERLPDAAYRSGDQWVPGAILVTNRAIVFFCGAESCTGLPPRLTADRIASVAQGPDDATLGGRTVVVVLRDGSHQVFGFSTMPDSGPQLRSAFDQARTDRLVESARLLQALPR